MDIISLTMDNQFINKLKLELSNYSGVVGKDKYFNCAVLIPIITIKDEYHLIFEKRAKEIRQGGEVSFPGGEFDSSKDDSFLDTAVRETFEEIGIPERNIEILGQMGTLIAPMGVSVDSFIGLISDFKLQDLIIDKSEVDKVFTVPLSYFLLNDPNNYSVRLEVHTNLEDKNGIKTELLPVKKLKLPLQYQRTWRGRNHRILVYENTEEIIWGITAELIYELIKILK